MLPVFRLQNLFFRIRLVSGYSQDSFLFRLQLATDSCLLLIYVALNMIRFSSFCFVEQKKKHFVVKVGERKTAAEAFAVRGECVLARKPTTVESKFIKPRRNYTDCAVIRGGNLIIARVIRRMCKYIRERDCCCRRQTGTLDPTIPQQPRKGL